MPKVILHNSISLDGSLTGFTPDMEVHYQIAAKYRAQANLIGSNTARMGVELFETDVPQEERTDFEKPERNSKLPYWVLPDTKGSLKGILHVCRRFQYCRDVIVLISDSTPKSYIDHLKERNYDFHVVGADRVDPKKALELLVEKLGVKTVLTDTGRILGNLLLDQGLVHKISLLVHPVIVGKEAYNIFENIDKSIKVELQKQERFRGGLVWLVYRVKNKAKAEIAEKD